MRTSVSSRRVRARRRDRMFSLLGLLGAPALTFGAEVDTSRLPPAAAQTIDFAKDIRPILETSCLRCHGPEKPKGGLRLDNHEDAIKGGKDGPAILPGNSAGSPLIHFVARLVPDSEMPPEGKGDPLTPEQVGLLRAWIDQGANYPEGAARASRQTLFTATAGMAYVSVKGNAAKFREDNWMPEGASGGIDRFEFREVEPNGRRFSAEGHIIGGADDYQVKLSLEQPNLGFVRAGFDQFHKWSADTGGYYPPFDVPPLSLDNDLSLRVGKAWIEAGLNRPGLPKLKIGYEFQYREGDKSTTQWGQVSDAAFTTTKSIYPSSKEIDETVHIVKVDASHPLFGVLVEDSFRGEFYDLRTSRPNVEAFTLGSTAPDLLTQYGESSSYFRAANTIRLEKSLTNWLLVSGGYLYSDLDGNAGFNMESFFPSSGGIPPQPGENAAGIVLHQWSHVLNANTLVGPWRGFTLTLGAQADWTRQHNFGNSTNAIAQTLTSMLTDQDRLTTDELVTLRYTSIPYTVVFGEARLQQEQLGMSEQSVTDTQVDFLRDTNLRAYLMDFRGGFTFSPWTRVSLEASYRHTDHKTDYATPLDTDSSLIPGNGYPGFLLARDIVSDEVAAKLAYRVNAWLNTSLKYQVIATEYDSTGAGATAFLETGQSLVYPAGRVQAANYDAHVVSASATVTPWRRLYLTSMLAYAPSRVVAGNSLDGVLAPYKGDVWTVLANATYALSELMDLTTTYSFSRARYKQDNLPDGLPLGIDYDRHGLTAGLTRRLHKTISASLQYGFFWYREPTAGGALDYTAHGLFATLTKTLK